MKLTRVERWILANQYRIREVLDTEDEQGYGRVAEALENGYELEYDHFAQHIYDDTYVLSEAACREVQEILGMFSELRRAYKDVADKSGIEEWKTEFSGFSGNTEYIHLGYVRYLCTSPDNYKYVDRGSENFDSHCPMLDLYRAMLEEWRKSSNQYILTKDDIIRITEVKRPE